MSWDGSPPHLPPAPNGFVYVPMVGLPAHQVAALQAVYQLALEQVQAELRDEAFPKRVEPHWN